MVYGETLDDVFAKSNEVFIPVFLPEEVITYCNDLIEAALKENNLPVETPLTIATKPDSRENADIPGEYVYWNVSTVIMWQQIDRRIDEYVDIEGFARRMF